MYTPIKNIPTESSLPLTGIENPGTSRATLIVSIALLIVVLGALTTLSFRLFPETTNRLSALLVTLFSREEKIEVITNPSTVSSDEIFTLSYSHSGRDTAGTYVLTYPCSAKTALYFSAEENPFTDTKTLSCDKNIDIAPKDKESYGSLFLVATKTDLAERISTLPITIAFIPEGTTTPLVKGLTTVIVENIHESSLDQSSTPDNTTPANPVTTTKPRPNPDTQITTDEPRTNEIIAGPVHANTYELTSSAPKMNGRPDLAVRIIETGTVDKITGAFTATSSFKSSDRIAVKFEIRNDGGREVTSWYFNAVLPSFPAHIFTSPGQSPLIPGARIEFTLGFDNVNMSTGAIREFVINADPASSIGEENESNNIAKIQITDVTP